jgi:hypothetical protein
MSEVDEDLEFWNQFEHAGWAVAGYDGKRKAVFMRLSGWDANGFPTAPESLTVNIDQVNFFKGAMRGKILVNAPLVEMI